MCKLHKLNNLGSIPLIFCCLGFTFKPTWSVWLHWHSPQKTESSLQPVGSSWMTERNGSPAICLSDSNMTVIISLRRNPILLRATGKYVTYFFFVLFYPPHTSLSLPPFSPSSLAWYLGHKGTGFSRQRPRAYCPLAPQPPICNWKHTNGLAGESSMPVGLLGLEWPMDSDPLIRQRGGKRGGEGRMMDRSRDLGSCETSIKINMPSEENMQTHRGR